MLLRILIGSLIFFSLGAIFYAPVETMLAAIQNVKTNVLFFILLIVALIPMSFISIVNGIPLNNVLTSVNKGISYRAMQLRMLDALILIIGMILLIAEIPFFFQVLLLGLLLYALHLILIGYLVFESGYLNRILGVSLVIGGAIGYLFQSLAGLFVPSLVWLSTIGVAFAIIVEISLAIALIYTAKTTTFDDDDSKTRIVKILRDLGEATTREIIAEATKDSDECKDRAPRTLKAMELENEVTKRFSNEKKGFVWSLVR